VFRESSEKKEEKERVRSALLRAALRLGAAHGFASLGLREVAREAGIAPTSFYRHFADMEELGLALSRELVGDAVDAVCASLRASRGGSAKALVDAMLAACASDPELMRFFVSERVGSSRALRASLQSQQARLVEGLRAAAHNGSSGAPPLTAAEAACVLVLDACARTLEDTAVPGAKLREACVSSIEHLLAKAQP
jgi:AcrR family transcriptional regulator